MAYNSYDNIIDDASNVAQQWNNGNDFAPGQSQTIQNSFLYNWLFPGAVQEKEFGQQVALQEMQNNWNSEAEKMARMKKAGINANVAAAGIAGAGNSPAAGSPNTAVGAGASGVGAGAQTLAAGAETLNSAANVYEKFTLTGVEKDKRKAEIRNLLSAALHNDWLAYSISEMLPLQKENERADTYLKLANYDKAREEKQLITKRIAEVQENINRIKNEATLLEKQGNLVESEQKKVEAQTAQVQLDNDKLQWDKDWRVRYRYDPNVPVDVALEQAMVNGASDDVVNAIGESVKGMSYNSQKGFNAAEIEDAYIKAFNEFKAKADVNADFAPYMAMIEANKQSIIEFIKMITENPGDVIGILSKLMNLIGNVGLSMQIDNGPVNSAKKPAGGVTITR